MAKKLSESSPRERLTRVSAEDMRKRVIPKSEMAALRQIGAEQAADNDSGIDYSDIPKLTAEQLNAMRPAKEMVSFRADEDVMNWLRGMGPGVSGRINAILRAVMEKQAS